MSSVLGIDVSSHAIDLVRLDETTNDADWTRLEMHGPDAFQRLRDIPYAWGRLQLDYFANVYIAGVEVPKTRFLKSAGTLFPAYGAVVALLPQRLPVWDVHPTVWRKGLGLPGNASKDDVTRAVAGLLWGTDLLAYDWATWPQDAFDAYGVAMYVRETNRRAIEAA